MISLKVFLFALILILFDEPIIPLMLEVAEVVGLLLNVISNDFFIILCSYFLFCPPFTPNGSISLKKLKLFVPVYGLIDGGIFNF